MDWLKPTLHLHQRLTAAATSIVENLLERESVDYLAVTGRTKSETAILEKIDRKGYKNPQNQITDITGIRIILYLESDIPKVQNIIESSFDIDFANSMNKEHLLNTNQIGYRSIHYVCDLGEKRSSVPEYSDLSGLKFEFQIRTVLQHAWAELSHDRNYKFAGALPPQIERRLFLYAGMLEIADRGFDEISKEIDEYISKVKEDTPNELEKRSIDTITLQEFFENWCRDNNIQLASFLSIQGLSELVDELNGVNVRTIGELEIIVPDNYAKVYKDKGDSSNIFGIIRDWMIINKTEDLFSNGISWMMSDDEMDFFRNFLSDEEFKNLLKFAKPYIYSSEDEFSSEDDTDE